MNRSLIRVALVSSFLVGCASEPVAKPPAAPKPVAPARSAAPPPVVPVADPLPAAPAPAKAQVEVDVTASRPVLAADKEEEIFVRVRVRGLPLVEKQRPPLNLALVVDASGSMEGAAIEQTRAACGALVDALQDGDALSIVSFGSKPKLVVEAVRISAESRKLAKKAIEGIVADGTTDMAGGIRVGLEQVRVLLGPQSINRIVLVGDGVPNDPASVTALADQARAQRIPVTSLGLGPEFDETLMAAVAQRSGGTFHFIDEAARVTKVFQQEIAKMDRLVARGTWVEIVGGPGVTFVEAFGGAPVAGRGGRIHIGDLTEGQVRDTILRVKLKGHRDGAKVELLDAVVHHQPAAGGQEVTAGKFAALRSSADPDSVKESNREVDHEAARLRVADGIVRAIALARGGDLLGARKLLDVTSKFAAEGAKRFEDAELKGRVDEIAKLKKTLPSLAPPPPQAGVIGTGGARPKAASPMAREEALGVRSTHGRAMDALQGR